MPSWARCSAGARYMELAPWVAVYPGVAIMIRCSGSIWPATGCGMRRSTPARGVTRAICCGLLACCRSFRGMSAREIRNPAAPPRRLSRLQSAGNSGGRNSYRVVEATSAPSVKARRDAPEWRRKSRRGLDRISAGIQLWSVPAASWPAWTMTGTVTDGVEVDVIARRILDRSIPDPDSSKEAGSTVVLQLE